MKIKTKLMFGSILVIASILFIINAGIVSAQGASYCCERTLDGAKCQNIPTEDVDDVCDPEYRKAPTSCESTGYCASVCCFDSDEGTCMPNTPRASCIVGGGVEDNDASCETAPQCALGCCLLGGQAAYVTQTRCKKLSSMYGLLTNFRDDIQNEVQCILSTTSEAEGACVFEKEFQTTCLRLTQRECNEMAANDDTVEFYPGMLCSADELATNCGASEQTTCVEGKDQVYYLDTCGNIANVYDFNRFDDPSYWRDILSPRDSCDLGGDINNAPNRCGNCDYLDGSICKEYELGMDVGSPEQGDYVCANLGCEYDVDGDGNEEDVDHGESWCAVSNAITTISNLTNTNTNHMAHNLPGSRYFRLLCYDGEVLVEPCADYRQEICLQSETNDFMSANCRVNRWEDCLAQDNRDDCENEGIRDCKWIAGADYSKVKTEDIKAVGGAGGLCAPKYAPGLDFWNSEGDAGEICSAATTRCKIEYERGYDGLEKGDWEATSNERCEENAWKVDMNNVCVAIGDCGRSDNYLTVGVGSASFYDLNDFYDLGKREDD